MNSRPFRHWTPDEHATAVKLRAEGLSYYAIAKQLGRDRNNVRCRLDPDAAARARFNSRRHRERIRQERQSPTPAPRRPWTPDEHSYAAMLRQQGWSYQRIGDKLARNKGEVCRRLNPDVAEASRNNSRQRRQRQTSQLLATIQPCERHQPPVPLSDHTMPPRSTSPVPLYGRHNHWSEAEYEALQALAAVTPRVRIQDAYRAWATENGYFNGRRKLALFKLLDEGGIQCAPDTPWSEAELRKLRVFADDHPLSELTRVWNTWASIRGYPDRNRDELEAAARDHLGLDPITPTGIWWTAEAAAEVLELPRAHIIALCIEKKLRGVLEPDGRWFVHAPAFRRLALNAPEHLQGASRFGILALTGKQDLAQSFPVAA